MFKNAGIAVLALGLASCGVPRPRPLPPNGDIESHKPQSSNGAVVYRVDSHSSELRVLVYRAGPMARFGHNHVMVNDALTGSIDVDRTGTASSISLMVPVAEFMVDDTKSRQQEGADFAGDIPDDAKSGTLHNMLSPALLNAAEYPSITVEGSGIAGTAGEMTVNLTVRIAGHESKIDVPVTVRADAQRLSATGSFDLRQTAVGLTPFSLMLGALQVQDAIHLKFTIVAVPESSTTAR